MSYNPHIAAARRAAKRLARDNGASHQGALDAIARRSGAESWSAFVLNPTEIGEADTQSADQTDIQPTKADTATHAPVPAPICWWSQLRIITIGLTFATMLFACLTLFTDMTHSSTMIMVQQDENNTAPHVTINGTSKPAYVTRLANDKRDVVFIIGDYRGILDGTWWRIWRQVLWTTGIIAQNAARARTSEERAVYRQSDNHMVHRARVLIDCSSGRYQYVQVQVADDYTGSPVAVISRKAKRPWLTLRDGEADIICSKQTLEQSAKLKAMDT